MSAASTFAIGVPALTQCQNASITWAGPTNVTKVMQVFVEGQAFFSETIGTSTDFSAAAGDYLWLCDYPAGLQIALEIHDSPTSTLWATSQYFTVLPGSTDSCLRKNPGQLATATLAALASSLSSASPQLFTYGSMASSTGHANATSSSSTSSAAASATVSSTVTRLTPSSGVNGGAVAGGVVGGLAFLALCGWIVFFISRRSRDSSVLHEAPLNLREKGASSSSSGGGIVARVRRASMKSVNPVETWRSNIARDSTGAYVETPKSPAPSMFPLFWRTPRPSSAQYGPRAGVPEVQDGDLTTTTTTTTTTTRGGRTSFTQVPSTSDHFDNKSGSSEPYHRLDYGSPYANSAVGSGTGQSSFPGGLYQPLPEVNQVPYATYGPNIPTGHSMGGMTMSNLAGRPQIHSGPPPLPSTFVHDPVATHARYRQETDFNPRDPLQTPVPREFLDEMRAEVNRGQRLSMGVLPVGGQGYAGYPSNQARPPTRMTTPGAMTSYGDGGSSEWGSGRGNSAEISGRYPSYR